MHAPECQGHIAAAYAEAIGLLSSAACRPGTADDPDVHRLLATLQLQLRLPASEAATRVLELDAGDGVLRWLLGQHEQIVPLFGQRRIIDDLFCNPEVDPAGIPVLIRALELTAGKHFPEDHTRDYVAALRQLEGSLAQVGEDGAHAESAFPVPMEAKVETNAPQEAIDKWGFIVAMFCTASHRELAQETVRSCAEFGLPYTLHQVDHIHVTLSPKASKDPSTTKPNFIHTVLERWDVPVLYLDCDLIVMDEPSHLREAKEQGADFAVCNHFADRCSAIFTPLENMTAPQDAPEDKHRLFVYTGQIPWYMPDQLFTNGAISWWNNTAGARALLRRWHQELVFFSTAVCHPCTPSLASAQGNAGVLTVAEDQVLDWLFNNRQAACIGQELKNVKPYWLPQGYARQPMCIYVAPIINHPGYPTGGNPGDRIRIPVAAHRGLPKLHMHSATRKDLKTMREHYGLCDEIIWSVVDIKARALGTYQPGVGFEASGPPLDIGFWPPYMHEWGDWPRPTQVKRPGDEQPDATALDSNPPEQ